MLGFGDNYSDDPEVNPPKKDSTHIKVIKIHSNEEK